MPKRKSHKSSASYPNPVDAFLDLAGAVALGVYAKHKLKKDYARGEGEESAKAASIVFGMGAMRHGSAGIVNLGGLIGINSAIKDINRAEALAKTNPEAQYSSHNQASTRKSEANPVTKYTWRQYCEDGSPYGISPNDYQTADDYDEALQAAKSVSDEEDFTIGVSLKVGETTESSKKHLWRYYCSDGKEYGIDPNNFESADDYEEAIEEAKEKLKEHN